ncbi:sugar phosphate isomerase/epimerase [Phragmitibacter flavus]|uniref:Sugar phosphate isomerase/epimerase n=1 Tax=Phragmitibacter flavus TaxID=2576071 RepID=A0A5R8KJ36_9BACT|nr:sugar phosphate isomerase/epimerase [Phragmitibacter flavus]TLD72336.1 sugar phosphate isomerase/epimerase [Phragmitibacter flavus]
MNRRYFVRSVVASVLASVPASRLLALEAGKQYVGDIGLQLYTLRDPLKADLMGTLKAVAEAGYKQVELFGFPDAEALLKGAKDVGLKVNSSHFQWDSAVSPKDDSFSDFLKIVEKAKEAGLTHLVVPYLQDQYRDSLDAYKKVAENLNKAAVKAKEAGVVLSYHNHAFEFKPFEGGKTGFDVFVEEFDAAQFELDLFWVKVGGLEPAELIGKLAGRVSQVHLKDLKEGIEVPNFGSLPKDAFKELGNGVIATEPLLAAAEKAGVKHAHVEQDQSPDPVASVKESIKYLKTL